MLALGDALDGEADIIGPFSFSKSIIESDPLSNRHLLMQLCQELSLEVSNTFSDQPIEKRESYFAVGASP